MKTETRQLLPLLPAIFLVCSCLMLGGCFNRGPDTPLVTHEQARTLRDPWRMKIVRIWDGVQYSRDPNTTHLVEARVLDGAAQVQGRIFTFPYDAWSVGKEPPARGTTIMASPYDFIRVHADSHGAPKGSESAFRTW